MQFTVKNADKIALLTASDVFDLMQMLFKKQKKLDPTTKEYFWVIALNQHKKILLIELISMGNIKETVVDPADVFTLPLHKRASGIILVHNHPNGYIAPSEADMDITTRLVHVGKTFRIRVADHVIITKHAYFSFHESGKLTECEFDEQYALTFVKRKELEDEIEARRDKIRQEGVQEGLREGEDKGINKTIELLHEQGVEQALIDNLKKALNTSSNNRANKDL